jgi:hypothetical protein
VDHALRQTRTLVNTQLSRTTVELEIALCRRFGAYREGGHGAKQVTRGTHGHTFAVIRNKRYFSGFETRSICGDWIEDWQRLEQAIDPFMQVMHDAGMIL